MSAMTQIVASELNHYQPETSYISRKQLWTGRVLSGIASAFFLMDGAMKLAKPAAVVQATLQLGYPESTIVGIGIVLLVCTALYLVPRTAPLGAVLLTGYLGGAVAAQVRVSAPLFNILFPAFFGCVVWAGLYLRDGRLRSIFFDIAILRRDIRETERLLRHWREK
jgi:DoxX-like family